MICLDREGADGAVFADSWLQLFGTLGTKILLVFADLPYNPLHISKNQTMSFQQCPRLFVLLIDLYKEGTESEKISWRDHRLWNQMMWT